MTGHSGRVTRELVMRNSRATKRGDWGTSKCASQRVYTAMEPLNGMCRPTYLQEVPALKGLSLEVLRRGVPWNTRKWMLGD